MRMSLYQGVKQLFEYVESGVHRVGTGIPSIDEKIRGVAPGEICMILGRSYAGKSIMGQNIVANNSQLPSIFFSMEMPYMQAIARLYSMTMKIPSWQVMDMIEAGDPPGDLWELPLTYPYHGLVDEPNITFEQMSEYIDVFTNGFGQRPAFVVIDYLELIGGTKRSGEGVQAVDGTTTHLKDWAKQEEMRVFVLHQCNRTEPRWEPPTEGSARYGGYTESDFVVGMWRPALNPELSAEMQAFHKNKIGFSVLKNRPFGEDTAFIRASLTPSLNIEETNEHF